MATIGCRVWQKVSGVFSLGQQDTKWNLIRGNRHLHIALVLRCAIRCGQALNIMGITVVAHSDCIRFAKLRLQILLNHHVLPIHTAVFQSVQLVRPMVGVEELVCG